MPPSIGVVTVILLGYLSGLSAFSSTKIHQPTTLLQKGRQVIPFVDLSLDTLHFNGTYISNGDEYGVIDAFYRTNFRKMPPLKAGDAQYSLRVGADNDKIVATLRLCRANCHGWTFLRSVCVTKKHRRQGLAKRLLELSLGEYVKGRQSRTSDSSAADTDRVYCFAEARLAPLYIQCGFENSVNGLPKEMIYHFEKLKRRVTPNDDDDGGGSILQCFQWTSLPTTPLTTPLTTPVNILLLQHEKEISRKTGTGKLLYGLPQHVTIRNQTWGGRVDNEALERLVSWDTSHKHVLLWTGGSTDASRYQLDDTDAKHNTLPVSFVLLDGTWQEAQSMFRKIPALQQLPRLSLHTSSPSNFTLRGDFGWKERFSSSDNNSTLLCTAEVAAELLQQVAGDQQGSMLLKQRLESFQADST